MSSSKTPEDFRWKQMLFAVSDYCRDRDDPSQLLSPDEVSLLVGGQEPQLKKLDLFKQLVDEGYINAKLMEAWKGGLHSLPFVSRASREVKTNLYPKCRETKTI